MLGGDDTDFTFLAIPDSKHIYLSPKERHGTFEKFSDDLASQNRKGAGVFVTVNKTDGKGRKAENIVRIRGVWQDDDNGFEGELPLEPTLEVESSPGKFHRYWVIDPEYGEMSFETFDAVMSVLVGKYGSDPNAKDRSRVLRLPGSMHMKNTPGHLVKIVGGSKERYPAEVIVSAFLERSDTREVSEEEKPKGPKLKYEWDWEKIKDALRFLSSDERSSWFKYGAAIHSASGGSMRGFRIWDDWSKTTNAGNYDFDEQERYWNKEFGKRSEGVTEATIFHDAMADGWEPWELSTQEVCEDNSDGVQEAPKAVDLSSSRVDGDEFPKEVIRNLRERFTSWGHLPTEGHWNGLTDMAKVFHRMAAGVLRPQFYLSSLPPGMGKTSVVIECTKALLGWDSYKDEGVIYFLSRLEEINSLVDKMGLQKDEFAVLVSEGRREEVPEGNPDRTRARILFTTQQQLETRSKGGELFAEMDAFYYRGKPRSVRVWDETITPSMVLTLERYGIDRLKASLKSNGHPILANTLDDWSYSLKTRETGDIVEVPDVNGSLTSLEDFRELFPDPTDKDLAEALWRLSGRSARIRRDNYDGATALEYEENLPDDLAPMLILDASGGLRETYSFWERHRKGLVRLEAPEKTYANQKIHVWNKGSGKKVYREWKKVAELAEGISSTINTGIPSGEDVLVIHSKQRHKQDPDITRMIQERLNPNRTGEVHFCNWGKHTATNQYAHIKHVFLAGILQYNEAQYEAVGRGAKKSDTLEEFPEEDFHRIRFGEITHNILQAACRGAVRKSVDSDCPEGCNLYIITPLDSKRGMTVDGIKTVFPESPVVEWFEKELTGKAKEAFDFIMSTGDIVTSSEVMSAIGMSGAGNFANLTKRDDFREALKKAGIELVKARGRGAKSYFQKTAKEIPWMVKGAPVEALPF